MPREGSWKLQDGSQLCSLVKIARSCEIISQPSWVSAKFRRHHFSPAKWFLKPPDICYQHGRYFTLDFCCLNPKILLVNHQLHDSLVFKLVKRLNIFVTISFILVWYIYLSGACSQRGVPSVTIWEASKGLFFLLPYLLTLYFHFISKLWILWGVFPREWVTKPPIPWS